MRVLLVAFPVRGGVMTHLYDLAEKLNAIGIQAFLAFFKGQKFESHAKELSSLNLAQGTCLFYNSVNELISFAVKCQITLLHAHSRLILTETVTAAQHLKIPFVFTIHGVFPWAACHNEELSQAARIIAVGPAQADSAGEFKSKIKTIQNGINIQRFQPDPNHQKTDGPLHVLWYGRTRGDSSRGAKAVDEAVGILRSMGRNVEATLIGVAAGISASNMVRTGWVSDPRPLLRQAHVTFGHGRSIREAMACGSAGFLLAHGYGGHICTEWFLGENRPILSAAREYNLPEPDSKVLSRTLMALDDNRPLLSDYREEARAISEKYFDVLDMARRIRQVYLRCFTKNPS